MKVTLEEINTILYELTQAAFYTKEARHVARKVYGNESEISIDLKYAYEHAQAAIKILEMRG